MYVCMYVHVHGRVVKAKKNKKILKRKTQNEKKIKIKIKKDFPSASFEFVFGH